MAKVRFGLVGCGNISRFHIAAIQACEQAELTAVCDSFEPNLQKAVEATGVQGYLDYRDLVRSDAVDAVDIMTASGLHAQIGIEAAKAGKHVIVEKPIDVTLEASQALVDACRENGVKLSCIFQRRFGGPVQAIKEAVRRGDFGTLNECCCHTKWYRDQAYYDCVDWRGTWALDGGGALMNQSIHYIDLMQYIMGDVDEVMGYTATRAHENMETEDVAVAALRFKSGALGLIEGTTSAYPGFTTRLDVHGDKGSVMLENDLIKFWQFQNGLECDESLKVKGEQSAHSFQINDFVDAILTDRDPVVTGEEALKALKIILAIYESTRTGKPVKVG